MERRDDAPHRGSNTIVQLRDLEEKRPQAVHTWGNSSGTLGNNQKPVENCPQPVERPSNPSIKDVEISDTTVGLPPPQEHIQQSQNNFTQTGGGVNNPQMQGINKIAPKGDFVMVGGSTNNKSENTAK